MDEEPSDNRNANNERHRSFNREVDQHKDGATNTPANNNDDDDDDANNNDDDDIDTCAVNIASGSSNGDASVDSNNDAINNKYSIWDSDNFHDNVTKSRSFDGAASSRYSIRIRRHENKSSNHHRHSDVTTFETRKASNVTIALDALTRARRRTSLTEDEPKSGRRE